MQGRENGSVVRNTGCSCRGLEFGCQQSHGVLQPPITPAPEDLTESSGFCMHWEHKWYRKQICIWAKFIHIKMNKPLKIKQYCNIGLNEEDTECILRINSGSSISGQGSAGL